MRLKIVISLVLSLVIFLNWGCSSVKEIKKVIPVKEKKIAKNIIKTSTPIENLYIEGKMTIENNGESQSGNFKMSIAGMDSVFMQINGPFGITVAKMYSTSDEFIFVNYFGNEAFRGTPSRKNLERVMRIPLSFNDLIHFIKCEPSENINSYQYDGMIGAEYYKAKNTEFIETLRVSTTDSLLLTLRRNSLNDKEILNIDFSNYQDFDGALLAKLVKMHFNEYDARLQIEIDEVQVNPYFSKSFQFTLPKNLKVQDINNK